MSHTLLILKIYTTFKDVQMILQRFFDISTGLRFSKISVECSVHLCSCPWFILLNYRVVKIQIYILPVIWNKASVCWKVIQTLLFRNCLINILTRSWLPSSWPNHTSYRFFVLNFFKIPGVLTCAWLFLTSEVMEAVRR